MILQNLAFWEKKKFQNFQIFSNIKIGISHIISLPIRKNVNGKKEIRISETVL